MVESSALLKRRSPKGYRGFESLPHRLSCKRNSRIYLGLFADCHFRFVRTEVRTRLPITQTVADVAEGRLLPLLSKKLSVPLPIRRSTRPPSRKDPLPVPLHNERVRCGSHVFLAPTDPQLPWDEMICSAYPAALRIRTSPFRDRNRSVAYVMADCLALCPVKIGSTPAHSKTFQPSRFRRL